MKRKLLYTLLSNLSDEECFQLFRLIENNLNEKKHASIIDKFNNKIDFLSVDYFTKMTEFYTYLNTNRVAKMHIDELMKNKYKENNGTLNFLFNFKKNIMKKLFESTVSKNDEPKPPPPPPPKEK